MAWAELLVVVVGTAAVATDLRRVRLPQLVRVLLGLLTLGTTIITRCWIPLAE